MHTNARRAHYGPAKPCPPPGTRVAYHGSCIAYHGIYPVVGQDTKGNAILLIAPDRAIVVSDGNRTITCPDDVDSPVRERMIAAAVAVLGGEVEAYLSS